MILFPSKLNCNSNFYSFLKDIKEGTKTYRISSHYIYQLTIFYILLVLVNVILRYFTTYMERSIDFTQTDSRYGSSSHRYSSTYNHNQGKYLLLQHNIQKLLVIVYALPLMVELFTIVLVFHMLYKNFMINNITPLFVLYVIFLCLGFFIKAQETYTLPIIYVDSDSSSYGDRQYGSSSVNLQKRYICIATIVESIIYLCILTHIRMYNKTQEQKLRRRKLKRTNRSRRFKNRRY